MKRIYIAEKNTLILILSLLPFIISALLAIYTNNDKSYLSEAINISGSQRMRTINISNLIHQNHDRPKSAKIIEDLNIELDTYLINYDYLIDGNYQIKYFQNEVDMINNHLLEIKSFIDEYLYHIKIIIDSGANDKSYDYITSNSVKLMEQYNVITEGYQTLNDSYINRQKNIATAMLLFAVLATVVGLILSNKIKKLELKMHNETIEAINSELITSQFLSNMSHEIRTPMNGILGFLELLEYTPLDEEQKEFVDNARGSTKLLLQLVNDILDFSKLEAKKVHLEHITFDIRSVINETIALIEHKSKEKKLPITTVYSSDVPVRAIGDPTRFQQILINLLTNAIKFTELGYIQVKVMSLNDNKNTLNPETSELEISIEDTGIGMTEEQIKSLFTPFTQASSSTTREYGGTGLGLTICKDLVELMQGSISIESTKGKGSIFKFNIILGYDSSYEENIESIDTVKEISKPSELLQTFTDKKPEILLVEDNSINQKLFETFLKKQSLQCDIVENGQQAVEATSKKSYDIVFMDCQMPVMNGFEATRKIRSLEGNLKHTPIVALTANAMDGDREDAIAAGMDEYITKPIHFKLVNSIMRKYTDM